MTRDELIMSCHALVYKIAMKWAKRVGCDREDLAQSGFIGLVKCADKFDPSKGFAFTTYAYRCIEGHIRHFLDDQWRLIRLPRDQGSSGDSSKARKACLERSILSMHPDPREEFQGVDVPENRDGPVELAAANEEKEILVSRYPERTAGMIRMRLEGFPFHEIGKSFGLSKERVRNVIKAPMKEISAHCRAMTCACSAA